jgi:RimJ/RimL family protein N-acetyltransferase
MVGMTQAVIARLRRHLANYLGRWPAQSRFDVVGSVQRTRPGWDGLVAAAVGVRTPTTGVLSVPPDTAEAVRAKAAQSDWATFAAELPSLVGQPNARTYVGVYRWCEQPAALPDAGVWIASDAPNIPDWLRPFGGDVLVALDPDTGAYLAGVGLKRHDGWGSELAVGTEPPARGRGLARRLVCQAARRVLDEGGVPTYQHAPDNVASARVAQAAGFPDRGWVSIGLGA